MISEVDDADADLGTIQVVATAKDGNNAATTANSAAASVPVVVDAVLDRVATPDQASAASATEQTTSQVVGLGLSLSFANAAYAAPSNQSYDGTRGDANETFAVKITVNGTTDLQLSSAFTGPIRRTLVTLTETAPNSGVWTLNGASQANVATAVAAVQAIVPANYDASVTGSIEVVSTDTAPGGVEVDLTDNQQTKTDTWALNIAPDVDPPTVAVTAGLTNGQLIVKEDGTATVSLQASVAAGTDDVLTGGLDHGSERDGEVRDQRNRRDGPDELQPRLRRDDRQAITIQVISEVDDADADLGTIQVVATAKDGNNAATTANSAAASVPVVVDAVLDRVATPDQASAASATEQTTSQVVGLGLSLTFANTAYAAPSNQSYDGTPGDANETFAVKITVNGTTVPSAVVGVHGANPGVTLTETAPNSGVWTLNGRRRRTWRRRSRRFRRSFRRTPTAR